MLARMRFLFPAVLLLALALPSPAHAQAGRYGRPAAPPDTLHRNLGGPWQLWGIAGFGWLASPGEVRRRYGGGLDVGLVGDRRFADRVALRGRVDFDDLPSSKPDAVVINGIAYATNVDYGHGWRLAATGGGALRMWNHLWLEGEAGGGYYKNGLGDTYSDLVTNTVVAIPDRTGWGATWGAGARYEFQPGRRDRVLGEFRFGSMDRDGMQLRFYSLRAGYRLF
jgi:hypothetical protein